MQHCHNTQINILSYHRGAQESGRSGEERRRKKGIRVEGDKNGKALHTHARYFMMKNHGNSS